MRGCVESDNVPRKTVWPTRRVRNDTESISTKTTLDLLDILIIETFTDATKEEEKTRLRTVKDLEAAALELGQGMQARTRGHEHISQVGIGDFCCS